MEVGNRIREVRKKQGVSMKELARRVGVSYLTIQRIETGAVSPSVAVLSDIAYCLKYPITGFFDKAMGMRLIRSADQPEIESSTLMLKLLVPKGAVSDKISVSLGKAGKGKFIDAHQNDGFEITYMLKGTCKMTYDGRVYEMAAGDIVLFDSERPHEIEALEAMEFINFYLRQVP